MLQIIKAQKKDISDLAKIYMKAYNAEWEKWTLKKSEEMIIYRLNKKIKFKAVLNWKIVWWFFSDVKPFYYWNIMIDWDLVVDPKYQKNWIWKDLFFFAMDYAHKNLWAKFREFYTFKNNYQYRRYKRLWFWDSKKFILMAWNIKDILKRW